MKQIWEIAKKELAFYLNSAVGYIIVAVFLILNSFFFFNDFFVIGVLSLNSFFEFAPWLILFFIAGLSMRTFAEEKRLNTIEVLLTLPLSEQNIVFGKFLGVFLLFLLTAIWTLTIPLSLYFFGKPYWPEIIVGYMGILLFAAMLTAIGNFISLLTKNQIVALLLILPIYLLLFLLGSDTLYRYFPNQIGEMLVYISPTFHLQVFTKGVLALRSVIYFVSQIGFWLLLSIIYLQKRK